MLNKENSTDEENKGFIKFILWIIFVFCITLAIIKGVDYYRLAKLEEEAKQKEEQFWAKWFEPADDEKVKRAVEAWNKEGIVSFFERDNLAEEMAELEETAFYVENDSLYMNKEEWSFPDYFKGMRIYSDEEKIDAMLILLYGTRGIKMESKVYTSSYSSVTEIPPALFYICIMAIDWEMPEDMGDFNILTYWRMKADNWEY